MWPLALAAALFTDPSVEVTLPAQPAPLHGSLLSPDRAVNLATYTDPELPLAPGVIGDVAMFIREHGSR